MTQEQTDKKYTEMVTQLGDFYYQRKNTVITVQVLEAKIKKLEGEIDSFINSVRAEKDATKVVEMKPNDA